MVDEIAYQNKDIISKVFAENFVGKSLKVYGLDLPKVVQVLPTNLPDVSANELRIDNLFLLEDGTIAIIDYESAYKEENKVKYLNYITRVVERYKKQGKLDIKIRMIVIYTADVAKSSVNNSYDIGALKLEIDSAFLSEIDSKEVMNRLTTKVNSGEKLTEEELMEFIILPLTYKDKDRKAFALEESFNLAKNLTDEDTMTFVLAGMLVFADKIIDDELGDKVKGWIRMTKVGRLFEAEKEAALAEKDILLAEKDAIIASVQLESAKAQEESAKAQEESAKAKAESVKAKAESAKAKAESAKAIARIKELEAQLAALKK